MGFIVKMLLFLIIALFEVSLYIVSAFIIDFLGISHNWMFLSVFLVWVIVANVFDGVIRDGYINCNS